MTDGAHVPAIAMPASLHAACRGSSITRRHRYQRGVDMIVSDPGLLCLHQAVHQAAALVVSFGTRFIPRKRRTLPVPAYATSAAESLSASEQGMTDVVAQEAGQICPVADRVMTPA